MHSKLSLTILFILCACVFMLFCGGCQGALRFAPTEVQKQSAELTHQVAAKVDAEGTAPHSPASQQLVEGTRAATSYIGRASIQPDPQQFDTTVSAANADAVKRPEVFTATEQGLSLAAELAILFGVGGTGFGGKKLLDWLKLARKKNKALEEIVAGNELFQAHLKSMGKTQEAEAFKEYQRSKQAGSTPLIVATVRVPIKQQLVVRNNVTP